MSSYFGGIITSTNPINTIYYVGNTISGILDTNNTITITPPYISETSTRYDFSPINAMVIGGGGGGGGYSNPDYLPDPPGPIVNAGSGGGGAANVLISFPSNLLTSNTFKAVIGPGGIGDSSGTGNSGGPTELNLSGGSNIISAGGGAGGVIAAEGPPFPQGGDGGAVTSIASGVTIINGGDGGKGGQGSNRWQNVSLPIPAEYNGDSSQFGLETASNPIMIPLIDISNNFNAQYAGCGGGGGGSYTEPVSTPLGGHGGGLPGGENVTVGGHYKPYSYTARGLNASGVGRGVTAQVYGGGGGGNSGADQTPNETGGAGKSGAVYFWFDFSIPPLRNGCEWNTELAAQTPVWNRDDGNCVDLNGAFLPDGKAMTRQDLSEKRKATIFQYKKNSAGFSKKQQYSRLARGIGRQKGQSFATQSDTYTNPNTHNLVLDNSAVLICPAGVAKNWAWTSQNDTPGPVRKITNEPTVPLTNYIVRRTYLAGNNKWPQLGPSFDPTSTSRSSRSSSSWGSPMVAIMYPSTGEYYQITFTNLLILYNNLSDEQKIALINNLEQVPNVETATVSSGSLQIAVIVSNKNYNNNVITEIRTALNTWTMDNNFSSGVSNSWTNSPILSTTPLYHNTLQIYYITGPFGDGSYIKGVIRDKNKLILTNNTNLNYPIYPPVIPSQDLLYITNIANIEDPANTENNYQISIQTYTKKNVLFSTTNQLMVTFLVPTVVINSPSDDADIFNNTFNLVYTTTNMGPNNKIVLYQGTDNGKDITNEPNPYPFTGLKSQSYTFKLQIVNKILALDPPIDDSIGIEMKVPIVEITNTKTIIYNNTFKLDYDVTNLGDNTIVLYQNNANTSENVKTVNNITGGYYTFTNLANGTYTFKLQIVNDDLTPNPAIVNEITDITIAIPTIVITSPSTGATINTTTFVIGYTITNLPSSLVYGKIYQTLSGESEIILGYFDVADGEGTVSILQYAKSPTTSGEYEYRLEILNEDGSGPATTDITKNQATVSVIIPKPTLVVNNNSRTTKLADSNGIEFTYYYFQYGSGRSFTLTNSPVILSIDILLVGGGGGGGWDGGYWGSGGGGAGAYLTGQITATLGVQYNITIGAGGYGANGVSSSIVDSGSGGTIAQALGGGRGADNNGTVNGGAGSNMDPGNPQTPTPRDPPFSGPLGSGGGGSGATTAPGFSYPYTYDEFTYSMNTGGYGYSGRGGGGGGGAGQVGGNAPAGWIGGNGGNGIQWDDNRWYGGGGAGQGVNDRSNENYGGNGGGGGQIAHDRAGNFWTGDATSNTGGGGAAGQYDNGGPGFRGGSGICVIRLPTSSFTT